MQAKVKRSVEYNQISADFEGQRIDNYLFTRLKNVPKSHIYRILRKGEVRVNKKRIQPSYKLQEGDMVRLPPIVISEVEVTRKPSSSLTKQLTERILYEDSNLLILNKPAGIPVHGGSKSTTGGIIEALRNAYPNFPHLELAHRLDADTSGCLIFAKKRSILKELHELLRNGSIHKVYVALTLGHWKKNELKVEAPLKKNFLASGERIVKVSEEGKASCTQFKVLKEFSNATLVQATLLTGRTHQIRVHAQFKGHPIACDEKYGNREFDKKIRSLGLKRLFLHAKLIEFTLPSQKQVISITAPLDSDLESCLNALD